MRDELTVVYYTANKLNENFTRNAQKQLLEAVGDLPLISVSKKPMDLGQNICVGDTPYNHIWAWRQALIGVKAAKTKYVALAEDDVFYSPYYFASYTPTPDVFAYNAHTWVLHTWDNTQFSWQGEVARMHELVCERDLFVETIEELFSKYPNDDEFPIHLLGEPGRKERKQGTTLRKFELFHTKIANVVVVHEEAIGHASQGRRRAHRFLRATAVPFWGTPEEMLKLCLPT